VVLEAHAGLDGRQQAHQASLDGVLRQQLSSEILLVGLARFEIADGSPELPRLDARSLLDPLARAKDKAPEVEEPDAGALQELRSKVDGA